MTPWVKYLLIIGAIQGFVFAFALSRIKSPKSKAANRILIGLLLIVSFFMALSSQADWLNQISVKITLLSYTLIFTYCPLFYLFTEALYVEHPTFTATADGDKLILAQIENSEDEIMMIDFK
ncbi:MAG: hypothetical protein RH948_15690 [Cyclobacteriaceae bacterium]